ncbi:hypothetical protein DF222_03550 [Corynebacterium yudongzhengii]|uniref:ATP-binding protein n=1 Tax=Corynebacterium yudongzhengii TaxID=2080740 RepID=A0A2U1T842_9CORY|nr:hypothetical protein [Corynebacterium yudongzhengii]PWC02174.1 hypothetical protein DF222_03550 [Corynebacterium yudongzhengii]
MDTLVDNCRALSSVAGFPVQVTGNAKNISFGARRAREVRYCLREITANVIKHGHTEDPVTITVSQHQGGVYIGIENSLSRQRVPNIYSTGSGLDILSDRMERVNGRFDYTTDGTRWCSALILFDEDNEKR